MWSSVGSEVRGYEALGQIIEEADRLWPPTGQYVAVTVLVSVVGVIGVVGRHLHLRLA